MSADYFVDSNVLVYAHDLGAGRKHEVARELTRRLWRERSGVVSTQVLQELYVNVRRKAEQPVTREEAIALIEDYRRWQVVVNSEHSIVEAIRIEERFGLSFWDALIVQAAQSSGAGTLYTEDLSHGQSYGSVSALNPFL
jgi:predicted nucleic acid-binding protein